MSKKRKLHHLTGVINYAWLATSKRKEPFYYLDITQENLWGKHQEVIYAFANLVSEEIWKTLAQELYRKKKYLFLCEKRNRGWRLKEMKEL